MTLGQRRYRTTDADTCLPPHNPAHTLADLFHNDMKVLIHSLLRRRQQRYYTVTAEKAAIIMDVLRVYRIHCMHAGLRRAISAVRILQRDDKNSILQAAGIAFEKSAVLRCLQQLLLTLRKTTLVGVQNQRLQKLLLPPCSSCSRLRANSFEALIDLPLDPLQLLRQLRG